MKYAAVATETYGHGYFNPGLRPESPVMTIIHSANVCEIQNDNIFAPCFLSAFAESLPRIMALKTRGGSCESVDHTNSQEKCEERLSLGYSADM